MTISLADYIAAKGSQDVKLHLGCGGTRWRDFINVDLYPTNPSMPDTSRSGCVADVFADIRQLGLPENAVDEIFTAHTIEHFTRWDGVDMLRDWYRMMKPGGRLVIETPDFVRCILWLVHPRPSRRRLARSQFYGNQWDRHDYETHRYVWSGGELRRALREIGFSRVDVSHRTETHYPGRDVRVVAYK